MIATFESPGKLYPIAASLLFCATREFLKWQTPVVAASELLSAIALVLRARIFPRFTPTPSTLANQHTVSITVESVALRNGMLVCRQNEFSSCKGGY